MTSTAPMTVPRIAPPSVEVFQREYVRRSRPVILTGLTTDWPALRRWSLDYLRARWGALDVPVVRLQQQTLGRDPNVGLLYETATFDRAIDLVFTNNGPSHYLIAPIEGPLTTLFDDVATPAYCAGKPRLRSRLWMSTTDTVSPLHRDFPENVYAQIVGQKRFILLPPRDKRLVYPYSMRSKLPQICAVDAENPDLERYPRFRQARPITIDVGPGDLFYLPGRWWHQVRTLTPSVSINWWWATGIVRLLANLADVYKRIRSVRL